MQVTTDYICRRLGEGFAVYRRRWIGDVPELALVASFLDDQFREATEMCKRLNQAAPVSRLQTELVARIRRTTDPARLERLMTVLGETEATAATPLANHDDQANHRPYRSINPAVPVVALASIDARLDVDQLDEEVA